MDNIILSIIVPIYNVESYLPRCIDSILAQTFANFELILIDDGSPDKCGEIMDQYAKRDERIITIHQENKGVSAARNAGLRIARGVYVGFIDPDDWIDPDMYKVMIDKMITNSCDLVVCPWCDCYPDGNRVDRIADINSVMTRMELMKEFFAVPRTIGHSNCNKLFKKALIKSFYDETLSIREDSKFLCEYSIGISHACYVNGVFYHAFVRESSCLRANPALKTLGLPVCREMIDIVAPLGETIRQWAEADFLDNCFLCLHNLQVTNDEKYYKLWEKEYYGYIERNWFRVLHNNNIRVKQRFLYLLKYLVKN